MPFNDQEKFGITDLLIVQEQNIPVLLQVARSITKNVCDIASAQEALDYICTHMPDSYTLLNKRHITKEVLFKYLTSKKVKVRADFTKSTLVTNVIDYWRSCAPATDQITTLDNPVLRLNEGGQLIPQIDHTPKPHQHYYQQPTTTNNLVIEDTAQYPIHLLARKFSEWFFDNYNKSNLKVDDFWSDARLNLRISANDRVDEQECFGSAVAIENLMSSKEQFGFFFNPNLSPAGVQGRMDVHGLVLVLACGSLHTMQNCVGVFECTFGLLRDPFAENNWKMKTIVCMLRSQGAPQMPSLYESDTLQDALTLPVPMGEFT